MLDEIIHVEYDDYLDSSERLNELKEQRKVRYKGKMLSDAQILERTVSNTFDDIFEDSIKEKKRIIDTLNSINNDVKPLIVGVKVCLSKITGSHFSWLGYNNGIKIFAYILLFFGFFIQLLNAII